MKNVNEVSQDVIDDWVRLSKEDPRYAIAVALLTRRDDLERLLGLIKEIGDSLGYNKVDPSAKKQTKCHNVSQVEVERAFVEWARENVKGHTEISIDDICDALGGKYSRVVVGRVINTIYPDVKIARKRSGDGENRLRIYKFEASPDHEDPLFFDL